MGTYVAENNRTRRDQLHQCETGEKGSKIKTFKHGGQKLKEIIDLEMNKPCYLKEYSEE